MDNNIQLAKVIQLSKPYHFEGKEYTDIDLSKIDDITGEQLMNIEKKFEMTGNFSALKEMNLTYAVFVASEITGLSLEFFKGLPGKDATKIRTVVAGAFLN